MIQKGQVSLKPYNTFGIDVHASYFSEFNSIEELLSALSQKNYFDLPKLILGGGSNILFTKDYNGLVLKNNISGIEIVDEDAASVHVKSGGGVKWHSLVNYCIERNFAGIENLSLIPGNCGAAPIQNIGAYGVELKDTFHSLEAVSIETGELTSYSKEECQFGYRDSIFKREMKGKLVITSIILKLNKTPQLNVSYGAIEQELNKSGIFKPSIKDVSEAVCRIRMNKLPDPAVIGNAGSFFKNPEIESNVMTELKNKFPSIVSYELPGGNFKLAAGWLIEQCGWKGKVIGNTGSHKDQALVLVNYGNATGNEILKLAMDIQTSVIDKFNVLIQPEVNVI